MPRDRPSYGGQDAVDLGAVGVGRREEVLHALLRRLLQPAQRGDLLDVRLAGLHDERAVVDVRLQRVHRALVEEVRVVVVQRAGEELDVERALLVAGGGAVRLEDAEAREQRGGLLHADLVVVERDVEVDVLAVADEAVVRDDRDLRVGGGLQLVGERRAVDRGDDQELLALGDHLVDLLLLGRDVVARVLQVDLVAGLLQALLDGLAVSDPALGGLRRIATPTVMSPLSPEAAPVVSSVLPAPPPEHAVRPSATTAPIAAKVIRRMCCAPSRR